MTALRRMHTKAKLSKVEVLRKQDITRDLMLMWLEKPQGYTFKPGQYCTIGSGGVERAYSIVSAPHEEHLELFLELVPLPDGALTPKLWELGTGDTVTIRPKAKGLFTMDPSVPNQLLVSTVTGVVPYVSIIRDYLYHRRQGHHFFVLQGASYHNEFTYDEEFKRLAAQHPDLIAYVPSVSRPAEEHNSGWTGETGRVNTIVEKYIERFGLSPEDTLVYACGHPGMIEGVKAQLIPKVFEVKEERFWKQD